MESTVLSPTQNNIIDIKRHLIRIVAAHSDRIETFRQFKALISKTLKDEKLALQNYQYTDSHIILAGIWEAKYAGKRQHLNDREGFQSHLQEIGYSEVCIQKFLKLADSIMAKSDSFLVPETISYLYYSLSKLVFMNRCERIQSQDNVFSIDDLLVTRTLDALYKGFCQSKYQMTLGKLLALGILNLCTRDEAEDYLSQFKGNHSYVALLRFSISCPGALVITFYDNRSGEEYQHWINTIHELEMALAKLDESDAQILRYNYKYATAIDNSEPLFLSVPASDFRHFQQGQLKQQLGGIGYFFRNQSTQQAGEPLRQREYRDYENTALTESAGDIDIFEDARSDDSLEEDISRARAASA